MEFLSRLFSKPDLGYGSDPIEEPGVKIIGAEGLPPERMAELEARAMEIRFNGRPLGQYLKVIRNELMEAGRGAPVVIEDSATGTTTVPANFDGLVVHVASWDSLLLDEELAALRTVVAQMIPAGLNQQHQTRLERAEEEAEWKHMEEEHPDDFEAAQGIDV